MQIMQFIKTHLITLICGLVALGCIGVAVLGMSSGEVVAKMEAEVKRITGGANIQALQTEAKNEDIIAKKKLEGELFEEEYAKTLEKAKRINRRDVLMGGVFPQSEKAATPFEFQEAYAKTMRVLYSKLGADTLPTAAEIEEEYQNVEELKLQEAEQRAEEEAEDTGRKPPVPGARPSRPSFGPRTPGGGVPPGTGRTPPGIGRSLGGLGYTAPPTSRVPSPSGRIGPGQPTPVRISTGGEPKYDPVYRARVAKAKSILCYYDEGTFHVSPLAYETVAPSPDDMWFAQVGLWVQQDVVDAIAELNRKAADQVSEGDACVEDVPIKRLVAVRVLGYEVGRGLQPRILFPEASTVRSPLPPDVGGPSLTGRQCNEQVDVIRFVVAVVIDQRDIPQLIDRISRINFYQCLGIRYEVVDHQVAMNQGYFYGTAPLVEAIIEFEGYMAREVYDELMPPAVRELISGGEG